MRAPKRLQAVVIAALAAGAVVSCDDPVRPPTTGSIAPQFVLLKPAPGTAPMALQDPTTMRVTVTGPTTTTIPLTLDGTGTVWTGRATGLKPGPYELTVEGLASGQVHYYGRIQNVTVNRGAPTPQSVNVAPTISTIPTPPLPNSSNWSQSIPFSRITGASGYVAEISQSLAFAGSIAAVVNDTNAVVTVNALGKWYFRTRSILPGTLASNIPYSDPDSFVVFEAPRGTQGAATALPIVPLEPDTVSGRNLTPAQTQDWFAYAVRAGDTIVVETRAARLSPASPLNTILTLYQNDGTTQIATDDNGTGTNDSRIRTAVPVNDSVKVRVTAAGGTSGHFELITQIRRLPAAPTALSATTVSGTRVDLAWTDNADNEAGFLVQRCVGAGCSAFDSVAFVAAGVTAYVSDTLTQGLDYRWQVRARNPVGNSAATNIADASTRAPAAPSVLVATTVNGTRIDLSWTDNADNETGFIIERCTNAACVNFAQIAAVGPDEDGYEDTGVAFGTAYRYQVKATNAVVTSAPSDTADANTFPPATPTALSATVAGANQINLAWTDNATDELGFYVERCLGDACVNFQPIDTVGADVEALNDVTVAFNSGYRYRVRAFHAVTGLAYTNIANADTRPPTTPTGLGATLVSPTEIELLWTDAADDETGYIVERCSPGACSNFGQIASLPAGSSGYTDATVQTDSVYRYRVYATGVPGNSATSNEVQANALRPEAPTALAASVVSADEIALTWTDNTNLETGYSVYRCVGVACTPTTLLATLGVDAAAYNDTTTDAGETYGYRVFAFNVAGVSDPTNTASANTLAPATPTALSATTVSGSRIDLAWTNNAPEAVTMRIERCTGPGCSAFAEIAVVAASELTYQDIGGPDPVALNNTYSYRIRAQNAADVSPYSNEATATTLEAAAPVTFTAATFGGPVIQLDWSASAGPGDPGYEIQRCTGAACSGTDFAFLAGYGAGNFQHVDNTVVPGEDYRYRIRAVNIVGPGPFSAIVNANTRTPATPTALAAAVMPGLVRLTWTDNADNEVGVLIDRCEGAACVPAPYTSASVVDLTTWDDSSVVANTEYTYALRASNNVGQSATSTTASANTLIAAQVTVLTAGAVSATQVDLAWTQSASQGTGLITAYNIYRCDGACDPATGALVVSLHPDSANYSDASVLADSGYTYVVVPQTAFGETVIAGSATAFASTKVPAAPSALVGTLIDPNTIQLDWTDNSSSETHFEVAQCAGVACTDFVIVATPATDVNNFLADTLTFDVRYRFLVRAVNTAGPSAWTDTLEIGTTAPAVPTGLAAFITDGGGNIQLVWTDASDDELSFAIDFCPGAGCSPLSLLTSAGANTTQFDLGSGGASTYRFQVRAVNAAASSAPSNVVEITGDAPYAAPTGTIATNTGPTSITLSWADNTNNETVFQILRCTGGACDPVADGAVVDSVPRDTTTFVDTTVTTGQLYRYQIAATNGFSSIFSATFDGHTMAADPPGTLSATALSNSEIALSWTDGGPFETGYVIERCEGPACGGFVPIDTVPANFVSYNDAGLTPNETYRYRVQAINAVAASAYSNIAEKVTDLPAAPTALSALAMTTTRIDLAWTDNADNEQFYIVERCAGTCDGTGTFNEIETGLAPNAQAYSDVTVSAGQTYSYRVRALNAGGVSPYTNIVTAVTAVPNDPSGLVVTTLSGTMIELAWTDNATNELSFQVERCTSAACPTFSLRATLSPDDTNYVDTVAVDDEYTYRVRAVNNVGASGYTTEETANTFRPATPTDFVVGTVSATRIDLAWTDNATNEDGYIVERCSGPGCSNFAVLDSLPPDATGYQNDGLATQTSFTYRVYAHNIAGPSVVAGPGTATTITPAAPTGLASVLAAPGQIDLTWADNADNEINYRVERCSAGTTKCATADSMNVYAVEVATLGPNTTFYSDGGLALATLYFYRVRATNIAGSSPYSAIVSRSTSVPPAPTGLVAVTQLATRIDLAWTDASANEEGFRVERCIGPDPCTTFVQIVELPAGTTSHADSTLSFGQEVYYRVLAFNGGGGNASNVASATTNVPLTPSDLVADAAGQLDVEVTWIDNASDEAGYYLERCTGLDCTSFAPIDTFAANTTAHTDSTVAAGQVYRYRLRAFGNGRSDYTPTASVATVPPNAATDLVATAISDTRIDLTWTDNTPTDSLWNETGFDVERCAGVACTPLLFHVRIGRDTTFFSDSLLTPGETYSYQVRATNNASAAAPSSVAIAATTVPSIPTALTDSTISASEVLLSWVDNATSETGYEIERCEGGACTDFVPVDTAGADAQSILAGGLTGGTVYRFRVRAFNASGSSGYSNIVSAQSDVPTAPTGLTGVTVSPTQVSLDWSDNAENETAYIIERCDGTGCSGFAVIDSLALNVTTYQDATIGIDTTFVYRVRASNAAGASAYTAEVTVSTYRPETPTDLAATPVSATQVDLTWTDVAVNDTVIIVERCLGFGCSAFADIDSLAPTATAYSDTTVTVNNTYNYRLRAENAAGASAATDSVEVGTFIPSDPSGLTANTNTPTQITLDWVDNSNTENDFLIERCTGIGCSSFDSLFVVAAGVVTYADTSVTLGNSYTYQVIARGGGGNSNPSASATAHTFPAGDVATLTASPLTATTLQLSWSAADFAALYQIDTVSGVDTSFFAFASSGVTDTVVTVPTGQVYNFVVRASNFAGSGAYAGAFVAMTPPPAPVNLQVFPLTSDQASLAWTDTSARETSFEVERAFFSAGSFGSYATVATLGANVTSTNNTVPVTGRYKYRVRAVNQIGAGAYSNEVDLTLSAPVAPSGLSANVTAPGQISLAWNDNSDSEQSFSIERSIGNNLSFAQLATVGPGVTTHVDSNSVTINTAYYYRVRAVNSIGASGYTNEATATTTVPNVVLNIGSVIQSSTSIQVSWNGSGTAGELGWRVYRCVGGGCTDFTLLDGTLPVDANTYTDVTAVYGNQYRYQARPYNIAGEPVGNPIHDRVLVLPAPSIFALPIDRSSVRVKWNPAGFTWETGFEIEECVGFGCSSFVQVATTAANDSIATSGGLATNGVWHRYRVRAVADGNAGPYSNIWTTNTPREVVLGATLVTATSAEVAATQNMTHYVVAMPAGSPTVEVSIGDDPNGTTTTGGSYLIVSRSHGIERPASTGLYSIELSGDTLCSVPASTPLLSPHFVRAGESGGCALPHLGVTTDYYITTYSNPYTNLQITALPGPTTYTFTTCAQAGRVGPAQGQCDAAYTGTALQGQVVVADSGFQDWTVPFEGRWAVTAVGAAGASATPGLNGGRGARIYGEFELSAGQSLRVAVGQLGSGVSSGVNGGGGGGSFVYDLTGGTPMVIAGGGGGTRGAAAQNGCDASTTAFAVIGSGGTPTSPCTIKVTGAGEGGAVSSVSWGSGGAGFNSNGADDFGTAGAGGRSWANFIVGGRDFGAATGNGGFGGGGAGYGGNGGGGGGGYSGGDGGWIAGGGGSFNAGTNQAAASGIGTGHGTIVLKYLGPVTP